MRFHPVHSVLLLCPALILLVLGCQQRRYKVGFELPAGTDAELLVLGRSLRIQIDSDGPGEVRLALDSPDDDHDEDIQLEPGTIERTLPGPVRLRCTAGGEQGTSVDVRAWGSTGMALDQTPAPRAAPVD